MSEKIVDSGYYRGFEIHSTSAGRFIAVVYGAKYVCSSLSEIKELIDDLLKTRRN